MGKQNEDFAEERSASVNAEYWWSKIVSEEMSGRNVSELFTSAASTAEEKWLYQYFSWRNGT